MTVKYQKVWRTMNDLEMVTSKICSAREIIDNAIDKIEVHQNDKAELLMTAAYEFLEYYLKEFDDKFKLAWQATVGDLRDGDIEAYDTATKEREHYKGKSWNSFWEENYYPNEYKGSTVSSVQYTEEELNAMCDKAASDEEKELCQEYNVREQEYCEPFTTDIGTVNKNGVTYTEYRKAKIEANSAWNDGWIKKHYQKIVDKYEGKKEEKTLNHNEAIAAGWTMTDDGFWIPPQKEDKIIKWQLPVEIDPSGEYFVSFPDDLLEAADLKEGDTVEWVDNADGSYTLKKVWKDPYKEEMLAAGYKMIDGRWQHPGLKSDEC